MTDDRTEKVTIRVLMISQVLMLLFVVYIAVSAYLFKAQMEQIPQRIYWYMERYSERNGLEMPVGFDFDGVPLRPANQPPAGE